MQHKEQKRDTSERDAMSYEEAALVPLSDELRGSLRMIAPKGCAIRYRKDHILSYHYFLFFSVDYHSFYSLISFNFSYFFQLIVCPND